MFYVATHGQQKRTMGSCFCKSQSATAAKAPAAPPPPKGALAVERLVKMACDGSATMATAEPGEVASLDASTVVTDRVDDVYAGVRDGPFLGLGRTGAVRRATRRSDGRRVAAKVVDLPPGDARAAERAREEARLLRELDGHPHVIRLEGAFETAHELCLVLELCAGGELWDRLAEQSDQRFPEATCADLVRQMLSALCHVHAGGVAHRDLKMGDFLFVDEGEEAALKMIDFGRAARVGRRGDDGRHDQRRDVWSIGTRP